MAPRRSRPPTSASASSSPFDRMVLAYLARKDRSEAEVRRFLAGRGASRPAVEALLQRMARRGYVNDHVFAERYARSRLARRPAGRIKLEQELLAKGVGREIAQRAVDRVLEGQSERDLAKRLLAQRFRSRKPRSVAQAVALLTREGFDEDVIEALRGRMEIAPEQDEPRERLRL